SLAIELILGWPHQLRAGTDGGRNHRIRIIDMKMDDEGARAIGVGRAEAHLGEFVREHERGIAEQQLRMPDTSARLGEAELLGRAERLLVEVDRRAGILDAQIGEELVDGHGGLPRFEAPWHRRSSDDRVTWINLT